MATAVTITKKSGKGLTDGVISELTTFWEIQPGHEEEVRAAAGRMLERIRGLDPVDAVSTGLRGTRMVIFDEGRRLMWETSFETDWDPYIEDAIYTVGINFFTDWMLLTTEADKVREFYESAGGTEKLNRSDPKLAETVKKSSGVIKALLQSVQTPATGFFDPLNAVTLQEISKAQQLERAFQQVLDDPAAEEALQHPALKPLLEQAAA
jgi:hypothetical protein